MTEKKTHEETVGLLFSGGLDSGILLGHLLNQGRRVQPFHVRSGLVWEDAEGNAIANFVQAMQSERLETLVTLDMPLGDLYGEHWSTNGMDTPDAESPDEAVYLPGRNALLILKPALWCAMHGIGELCLGVLASNPFADATAEFFTAYETALECAMGGRVRLVRPFAGMVKKEVMAIGRGLPLEHTFSCIAPKRGFHCGRCNKCAERQRAFAAAGMNDPTEYAS